MSPRFPNSNHFCRKATNGTSISLDGSDPKTGDFDKDVGITASGFQVISFESQIYIIGGEFGLGRGRWNNKVWKYDTFQSKWENAFDLDVSRRHHTLAIDNGSIFIIGGFGRHRVILNLVEKYDIKKDTIETILSLPDPMYNVAACFANDQLYVLKDPTNCLVYNNKKWVPGLKHVKFTNNFEFNSASAYQNYLYFTGKFNSSLYRCPLIAESDAPKVEAELVGKFKSECQNICLVEDKIYNFSSDQFDHHSTIEVYDLTNRDFKLVYESNDEELDFSPYYSFGCFPLMLYPRYKLPKVGEK